ncbi:ABC transporter permease [Sulfurisoma sediminicola]|uniref:ABC-type lipoprotein release transport system permease subunit n=1 Tax=Sulfurisoma sediminicola TaxID=1381557 RepID=A0A497X9I2_9PROT|nr:FtsX-like permease family protein [Sulfurisoma sediminicola]RLJ62738.1 ABC-type lipoprotein release transport system permease subunit [Sulfurisoma sediminicola]
MKLWLEKQRYLIDFTLESLARRKARNLGLLGVYTVLVFVLASVALYTHALRQEAANVLAASPEVILQRLVAGRHDLIPPGYIEKVGRIRGVQKKEGRLWGYYYDAVVKANYTFMVPNDGSVAKGEIVVGPALERSRGLAAGNGISFRSYSGKLHTFIVASVLPQASEIVSADLLLMHEDDFRAFFDYPAGHYTDIALTVANPQEVRNVATKLAAALPDSRPILRDEVLRTYASIFDWREGIVLALLSAAILAFGILAWEKASGLSAEEKREIGILKAIGWETGDIIKMKFWEGLLISLTAFLAGFVAAYVHVFYAGAGLFEPVLKGWAVLYPEFRLTPHVDGLQVATLFFFTVFPYAAAVLVPIWKAAITDPDAVMRG